MMVTIDSNKKKHLYSLHIAWQADLVQELESCVVISVRHGRWNFAWVLLLHNDERDRKDFEHKETSHLDFSTEVLLVEISSRNTL